MERPTIEIKTPHGKHVVVMKEYLNGKEKRAINAVFMDKVTIKAGADAAATSLDGLRGTAMVEYENAQLQNIVVSVDGKTDNVLEALLEMRSADLEFVVKTAQDVFNDKDFAQKKTN